jgi:hypothetical protein
MVQPMCTVTVSVQELRQQNCRSRSLPSYLPTFWSEVKKRRIKSRRLWAVYWANYSRLERAWFIMWLIKLPKIYNSKFVFQNSVCTNTFLTALRISAPFPTNNKYSIPRAAACFLAERLAVCSFDALTV